jgi:pilus assembly protein Flp/PilA
MSLKSIKLLTVHKTMSSQSNNNQRKGKKMLKLIKRFLKEEDGVTAIEYGLIAALVAVVIIVGAGLLGTSLNSIFTEISSTIDRATPTE